MPLALITGASTGIGRATRAAPGGDGWTVLAGVRDPAAGEQLAAEAAASRAVGVVPLTLDVTDAAQIARPRASASSGGGRPERQPRGGARRARQQRRHRRRRPARARRRRGSAQAVRGQRVRARWRSRRRCCRRCAARAGGSCSCPRSAGAWRWRSRPYAASKHAIEAFGDALRVELHALERAGRADRARLGGDADLGQGPRRGRAREHPAGARRPPTGTCPAAMEQGDRGHRAARRPARAGGGDDRAGARPRRA